MSPISRQEKSLLERESPGDPAGDLRERDRLRKQHERAQDPDNMRLIQALREFLGLQPLPGIPERK